MTTQSGSYYIGIDLELFSAASKDYIFAGFNSNTSDIFCVMNFLSGAALNLRFDSFALFDQVIAFENNTAFVKF